MHGFTKNGAVQRAPRNRKGSAADSKVYAGMIYTVFFKISKMMLIFSDDTKKLDPSTR